MKFHIALQIGDEFIKYTRDWLLSDNEKRILVKSKIRRKVEY